MVQKYANDKDKFRLLVEALGHAMSRGTSTLLGSLLICTHTKPHKATTTAGGTAIVAGYNQQTLKVLQRFSSWLREKLLLQFVS